MSHYMAVTGARRLCETFLDNGRVLVHVREAFVEYLRHCFDED